MANDSLVQWAIINFGGSIDPSLRKAASDLVNLVGGVSKATQTEAEKLVNSFGNLQGGINKGMGTAVGHAHETVMKVQAELKALNSAMDNFDAKQKRREQLYTKGSKTFTPGQHDVYNQSRSIVSKFGDPKQIANDINRVENELKRYEKLVERVKKGEVLGPNTHKEFQSLSKRNFQKEIAVLNEHGKELQTALNNIELINKTVMKRLSNSERAEWAKLTKETGAGMDLLKRMTTQKSKELEAARLDLERKYRAASNRTFLMSQQFRQRVAATQSASDIRSGQAPTQRGQHFYDQQALQQLRTEFAAWERDGVKMEDRLRRFALIFGENHKAVKATKLEWQLIGELLIKEMGIAEQQVRNQKAETEEMKKQNALEKQITQEKIKALSVQNRQANRMIDISGSKSGVASRSQLSGMLKDINAIEVAQKRLRDEINNADPADKKFINGKKAVIKALEQTKVELGTAYTEHKKLRDEIEKKAGRNFLDGFITGIRRVSLRSVIGNFANEFKKAFTEATSAGGGMGGGIKAGLGAVGGFGAGFAAIALPVMAVGKAFQVAQGLAGGFFNVLRGGLNSINGFIQSATAARQEVVQFSLATGLAMKDAEQINAVFRTWGLDTYWTAMSLEGLNKVIVKNSKALTDMGIASRDAEGNARKVTDVLKDMRDLYQSLDDGGKRNFLSNLQSTMPFTSMLLPLITGDFDKTVAMLEKMNVIMKGTDSGKLVQASAAMQTLRMSGLGLANAITSALAPALVELGNAVANLLAANMDRIQKLFSIIGDNIASFIHQVSGFIQQIDIVNSIAQGMIGGQGAAAGGKQMDLYQTALDTAKETSDDLADSIEATNEQLEDQNDILSDLRDTMETEIEVVNDLKEAEKDAFDAAVKPLETQNKALEKQITIWDKLKKAAVDALDAQIKTLDKANDKIKKDLEIQTKPMKDRLKQIAKEKKAASRAKEAAMDALGDAPESGADAYSGQIDSLQDQNKATDKQIKNIRDASKAYIESKNDEIEVINDLKEAIKDQQDAITDARDAYLESLDDQKKALQDQIDAIQEVSDAASDAARLQEYYDRRAYLMGQTLLAQAEARARSLSVRQERMRNSGEGDVDYQLRMQQLNAQLDVEDITRQDEIRQLDLNHATELATAAINAQIKIIEDQIEAINDLGDARKEADETILEGLKDQTEAYDDQIEAIRDLMNARQEADDAILEGLDAQKEAVNEQIESLREASDAAKEAADAAKDAWNDQKDALSDSHDAAMDALEDEADALQDLIDAAEEAADAEIAANDEVLDSLKDKKDAIEDYYDGLMKPLQDQIDANKEIIDGIKEAHDLRMELMDDEIEAIRDRYKPELDAQEQIIKNLQRQKDEYADLKKIQDKIKTDTEASMGAPSLNSPGTHLGGAASDDNVGAKIGKAFFDTLIAPFLTEAEKAKIKFNQEFPISSGSGAYTYEDKRKADAKAGADLIAQGDIGLGNAMLNGPSTERPDLSETIMQVLKDTWTKLEPYADTIAREVASFLWKVIGKGFSIMGEQLGDWLAKPSTWLKIFKIHSWATDELPKDIAIWLVKIFLKAIDNMIELIIPGWDDFFSEFFTAGVKAFEKLPQWLYENIIERFLKFIGIHEDMIPHWEDFWNEFFTAGINILSSIATWLWDHIGAPIVDFAGDAVAEGGDIFKAYTGIWKSFFETGFSAFKNIGQWLMDTIGTPMINFFSGLPGSIGKAFSGLWGAVSSPIRNVYDGFKNLWNGVAGFINKIAGAIGLGDSIIPTFSDNFQEPFVSDGTTSGGGRAGNGGYEPYAKGGMVTKPTRALIGEGGHDEVVLTSDPKHSKRTMGLLGQFLGKMGMAVGGPFDPITDPLGDIFGAVTDPIGSAFGAATDVAKAAVEWTQEKLLGAADSAIVGMMNKFLGSFRGNAVGDTVYGVAGNMKDRILGWLGRGKGKFDADNILDLFSMFGGGVIPTQSYGMTNAAREGLYGGGPHTGVDIASSSGLPIPLYAPGSGDVIGAGDMGDTGYGKWLQMAFGSGDKLLRVLIGHLSEVVKKAGEKLMKGDLLGAMGTTGYSTGVHTHIEVRDANGNAIDPGTMIPQFSGFWGSDISKFAKGGLIKPNSTLLDAGGRPYAQAGEAGLEAVTPIDFLKGIVKSSVASGMSGRVVLPTGSSVGGNTYSFTVGDIHANTKEDAQYITTAIREQFNSFLDELPAHAKPTEGMGVR